MKQPDALTLTMPTGLAMKIPQLLRRSDPLGVWCVTIIRDIEQQIQRQLTPPQEATDESDPQGAGPDTT